METDREIYEAIGGDLVRLATVLVGPDEAPDVVSRVVARRLAKGPLSELRDPRSYLLRAVSNEAKNVRRSRSRADVAHHRMGVDAPAPDIAEGRFLDVTDAVMLLPGQQRAAVFLVYWMDMTAAEAAKVLRCRPATVRRYLSIARDSLRGVVDE